MATNLRGSSCPALYTNVTLQNNSDDNLLLSDQKDWYGSANTPPVIPTKTSAEFKHEADPSAESSKGGVVYAVENGIKWVIAWSNMDSDKNKVYVDITKEDVDWPSVEYLLANSASATSDATKDGFTATATIQPDSSTPSLTANLKKN